MANIVELVRDALNQRHKEIAENVASDASMPDYVLVSAAHERSFKIAASHLPGIATMHPRPYGYEYRVFGVPIVFTSAQISFEFLHKENV